jgi:hypothetical protein
VSHPRRREFDFALLHLEKTVKVKDDRCLNLAEDYRTTSDVQMPMVQRVEGQGEHTFRIVPQNKQSMEVGTGGILKHNLTTKHGDSGTPLLVQPPEFYGDCLAIAIHASQMKGESEGERKSVRFTRAVVDQLVEFEMRMTQSPVAAIKLSSLNFEALKEGPLVEEVRKIGNRVSQQFVPLIEEARQREAALTEEQVELREDAQLWIEEDTEIYMMRESIFGTGEVPEKREKQLEYLQGRLEEYLEQQGRHSPFLHYIGAFLFWFWAS